MLSSLQDFITKVKWVEKIKNILNELCEKTETGFTFSKKESSSNMYLFKLSYDEYIVQGEVSVYDIMNNCDSKVFNDDEALYSKIQLTISELANTILMDFLKS